MPKITKRLVEAAEVREKDYIICDNELRGFAVRVLPSGKRYYKCAAASITFTERPCSFCRY